MSDHSLLPSPAKQSGAFSIKPLSLALTTLVAVTGLATIASLTGCGSSDDRKASATIGDDHNGHGDHDGHDHSVDDAVNAEIKQGRLFITGKDKKAYIYSLAQGKVIQTLDLDIQADALQQSPNGGYALILDRTNQAVNFYSSGLSIEDHGDHDHPYAKEVSKLPLQLNYARPVHYQMHGEQAGLFFDGLGREGNPIDNPKEAAGFALITDEDISKGKLPFQRLNTNMHGTAEPRGQFVVSTSRLETIGSPLADTVAVYHQHGDHYHLDQAFETKCSGLHGSGSIDDYTVFACGDGVLSVKQTGDTFSAEKITYPASLTNVQCPRHDGSSSPARIGSFTTNSHLNYLIGTACGQPYHIDPATQAITPIIWTTDSTSKVVSYSFDAHGETLMLLDNTGKLHLLDTTQNHKKVATLNVLPSGVADGGHGGPALILNPNTEMVYVIDANNNKIVEIDPENAKISKTIALDFVPTDLTWVGVKTKHDHAH